MKRNELLFQARILDSHKKMGGYGKKWATQMTVGVQDLVVSLPGFGVYLIEVKHRPDWTMAHGGEYLNPMEPKQIKEAQEFIKAGGVSILAIVFGSDKAPKTRLAYSDPLSKRISLANSEEYVLGKGYNVSALMKRHMEHYNV